MIAKPSLSLNDADLTSLLELITFLELCSPLAPGQARELQRAEMDKVLSQMVSSGETLGQTIGTLPHLNQPEADFRATIRATNDDLGWQVAVTRRTFDDWFRIGLYPAPYYPERIAVILRKAKRFDLEREFLAAYRRHMDGRPSTGRRAEKLGIPPPLALRPGDASPDMGC